MDDQSPAPQAPVPPAGASRRWALWPLAAVAIVAVAGAGAGAYFGLRGAHGPASGPGSGGPPARAFAAAAFDEASHQVVLFGGMGADGTAFNDTWTWDGSGWTQQHPQTSPPGRAFAAMTYDPKAHDVVLVGGRTISKIPATVCSGGISAGGPNATPGMAPPPASPCAGSAPPAQYDDTWLWDGGNWHAAAQAPAQLHGQTPVVGTDPSTGQVLMLGMLASAPTPALMCPVPLPSKPGGPPIVQPAIACGTIPAPQVLTWTWTGRSWTELPSVSPPAPLGVPYFGAGILASDPASGHLIDVRPGVVVPCGVAPAMANAAPCPLSTSGSVSAVPGAPTSPTGSGGASGGSTSASGAAPTTVSASPQVAVATPPADGPPASPPAPPSLPCCGNNGSLTTWTGSAWKDATTFSNGPAAIASMLAGDPAERELVAYTPAGTWTWDGSVWTQKHPAASPPPVQGASLVYDGVSGKLLLFGGEALSMNRSSGPASQTPAIPVSDELWAWDGSTWTQLTGAGGETSPSPTATPTPAPTFMPPATPQPSSSPSGRPSPLPSPSTAPCTPLPAPTPVPGKASGTSTAPNTGCVVPTATAVSPG